MASHKVTQSWFNRYRTAVLRMREAQPSEFAKRARRLAAVLREQEIGDVRDMLTEGLNIQPYLDRARSDEIEFGEPFPFPDDTLGEMGIAILLLDVLASSNELAEQLALNHYDTGDPQICASWMNLVDQIYVSLEHELHDYLAGQGWLEAPARAGNHINIHGSHGVTVQQSVSNSTQTAIIANGEVREALSNFDRLLRPLIKDSLHSEFDAEIKTIEAQLAKSAPSSSILMEAGKSLRSIVEGVAAGSLSAPAAMAAQHLWSMLGMGS